MTDREKILVDRLHAICSKVEGLVGWRYVAIEIQRDINNTLCSLQLPLWRDK